MKIKFVINKFLSKIIKIEVLNTLLRKLLESSYIHQIVPKEIIETVPVCRENLLATAELQKTLS